jgi:hypothetical protein
VVKEGMINECGDKGKEREESEDDGREEEVLEGC